MGILSFLIATAILLAFLHWYYQQQRKRFAMSHAGRSGMILDIDDLKSCAKSGDIIAFSSDFSQDINYPAYLLMNMLQFYRYPTCITSHYGIVYRIDGQLYVHHLTSNIAYHEIEKKYVERRCVFEKLEDYIGKYPGFCILYSSPNWMFKLITKDIINQVQLDDTKLSSNVLHWIFNIGCQLNLVKKSTDKLTCYEHVWMSVNRILGPAMPQPAPPSTLSNTLLEARLLDLDYAKRGVVNNLYFKIVMSRDTDDSSR
jgi:hypothetical protein